MRKILIIHAGAIGDFILALPALAALRRAYPPARIEIIARPAMLELARMGDYADQTLALESSGLHRLFVEGAAIPEALAADLRTCDGVVSWFGSRDETYRAALMARCPRTIIPSAFPPPDQAVHVTDYLLSTITPLLPADFVIEDRVPRLRIPPAAREAAETALASEGMTRNSKRYTAIHPGSGSPKKCWSGERMAELARTLEREGAPILIIEGPADAAALKSFAAHYGTGPARRLRPRPLTELAAILSLCERFIGHDSGITHLAAAVGTPALALFGPTDPAVWGPRGRVVRILHQPLESLTVQSVLHAMDDL